MPDVVSGGRASERNSSQFPKPIHRRLGGRSRRANCPKQDHVRAREHPSRSASSRRDRVRPSGGRDMNPNALLAGARGRAVRAPTGLGLRQGFPPCLRRLPRPRRPALRRRVQRSLQRRQGSAGTSPARAATVASAALRRFRGRLAPRAHRRAACLAAEQPLTAALPLARTLGESDRKACPRHHASGPADDGPGWPSEATDCRSPCPPRHPGAVLALGATAERARKRPLRGYARARRVASLCGRLWIRIGAPWNLDASLAGRPLSLPQTVANLVVTASGIRAAATG